MSKKQIPKKSKVSTKFVSVLAIISIFGFTEILLQNFFNLSIREYSTFAWLIIMGVGVVAFVLLFVAFKFYSNKDEKNQARGKYTG